MEKIARFAVLFSLVLLFALWSRHRTLEMAGAPSNRVQFEDVPASEIHALDLSRDGFGVGGEVWIDALKADRTAP